jgi:hypothetical protein
VSDVKAPAENGEPKKEIPVEGLGLVALGAYLVVFTLAIAVVSGDSSRPDGTSR